MVANQPGAERGPEARVLVCGAVPPLANSYYPRQQAGLDLVRHLGPGEAVVLVHGADTPLAPAAQGGSGKTQLAVNFAQVMVQTRAVELLVWVTAASRESVITSFAEAANAVDAAQPGEGAEAAAARFISWLARTRQAWAVVLDDLVTLNDLAELWPSGPAGRLLITSRLPAMAFDAMPFPEARPRVVPVGGLSSREALTYITSRLTEYSDQRIEALDLGEDLEGLPLALGQAASVLSARGWGCREYRARLSERLTHMPTLPSVSAAVLSTWSIAAECADILPPAGLAWPALTLASTMDHHGIPGAVLTSAAACSYIFGRPSSASTADQTLIRATLSNLAQAGLITVDPASPARTVLMHATVQTAVRAYLPPADIEQVVLAAADALAETWPSGDASDPGELGPSQRDQAELEQALRACATPVQELGEGLLWKQAAHPVLVRAGLSLEWARLSDAAIEYWESLTATGTALLGPGHADTVAARDRLAVSYERAGRPNDAVAVFQGALADRQRALGSGHAATVAARARLAHAYVSAGRPGDAVEAYERTAAEARWLLGPVHSATLDARTGLAEAHQAAGQPREAIQTWEQLLADTEAQLGPVHPATLSARASLATAYAASGRSKDAIRQFQRTLADHERANGPDHQDTIAARAALASAFRAGGKQKDALAQYEQVVADRERTEGSDHLDTVAARANLAYAYRSAGRLRDAVPLYERTLADRVRIQGPDHRDTLTARSNLAGCYTEARRLTDAVAQYERALADSERMLGPGHMETLTTRYNLATAHDSAGQATEAVAVLQRTLADCDRYLGPDHQMTQATRRDLDAVSQAGLDRRSGR